MASRNQVREIAASAKSVHKLRCSDALSGGFVQAESLGPVERCVTSSVSRVTSTLVVVFCLYYPVWFAVVASARLIHPFELEWNEGGNVETMRRVLRGEPLYGPPTAEYTPSVYPPFYYVAGAFLAQLGAGDSFLPLRLISFVSTLLTTVLIGAVIYRETQDRTACFFGASLYLGCYETVGTYFDIVKADSLWLTLVFSSAVWVRYGRGSPSSVAAAAATALALYTKQTAIAPTLAMALFLALFDRRRCALYILVLIIIILLIHILMYIKYGNWFGFYTGTLLSGHPWRALFVVEYWRGDVLRPLGVAVALSLLALYTFRAASDWRSLTFAILFSGALLLVAWVSRLHDGGALNVLMPSCAILAAGAGHGWGALRKLAGRVGAPTTASCLTWLIALSQLIAIFYNPRDPLPLQSSVRAGEKLIGRLKAFSGPVYVPVHPHYATLAGKAPHAFYMFINDVLRSEAAHAERASLDRELSTLLRSGYFDAVVLDFPWRLDDLKAGGYRPAGTIFDDPKVFRLVAGDVGYVPNHVFIRGGYAAMPTESSLPSNPETRGDGSPR